MPRSSRPWALPVACAALGVIWVTWLAQGGRGTEGAPQPAPPPSKAQAQPQPPHLEVKPSPPAAPGPPSEGRAAGISLTVSPTASGATAQAQLAIAPPLQLAFQTPTSASVGEAFDVRVSLSARQLVGRVAMEIVYDAALLKARSTEEIDYSQRTPGEGAFLIERASDGQVAVAMVAGGGAAGEGVPASAAVIQFEALAPGGAQIHLSGIAVSDTSDLPLPFEATGEESLILVR